MKPSRILSAALLAIFAFASPALCADKASSAPDAPAAPVASATPDPLALPPDALPLDGLRHAVACPPFQGPADLASVFRDEIIRLLTANPRVEFLEGAKALAKNAPAFIYHLTGQVAPGPDGELAVTVRLVDVARKETIATYTTPASTNRADLAQWCRTIRRDMTRRARAIPFECAVQQHSDSPNLTLDRGLSSGLQPGMVLYVLRRETPILSHATGQEVGRDTPRALGLVKIYRVVENAAYARPLPGTVIPKNRKIYAREF